MASIVKIKSVKIRWMGNNVIKEVDKARARTVHGYGLFMMRDMKRKLKKHVGKETVTFDGVTRERGIPSEPGSPPKTTGALKAAIGFEVSNDESSVIIGPRGEKVANVGKPHEFGGEFRGRQYKKRPFAKPTLDENLKKLPKQWQGAVRS